MGTSGSDNPGELVQGWFRVSEPEPGVFAIEEPLHDEQVASYLIVGAERALLIDAGMGVADIRAVVEGLTSLPVTLLDRANRLLFSTDVVYAGKIYAHMPGSDLAAYRDTMVRLAALAPAIDAVYPAHNERPIGPDVLPRLADALGAILDGRQPEESGEQADVHRFGGVTVLVPPAGTPA